MASGAGGGVGPCRSQLLPVALSPPPWGAAGTVRRRNLSSPALASTSQPAWPSVSLPVPSACGVQPVALGPAAAAAAAAAAVRQRSRNGRPRQMHRRQSSRKDDHVDVQALQDKDADGSTGNGASNGAMKDRDEGLTRFERSLDSMEEISSSLFKSAEITEGVERSEPPLSELLQALQLQSLSEEEIQKAFEAMDLDGNGNVTIDEVQALMIDYLSRSDTCPTLVRDRSEDFMYAFDADSDGKVSLHDFSTKLKDMSKKLDKRVWPLALCVGIVAMVASMIHPLLPLLAKELGLSLSQYGLTTSIYGVTKTLAGLPAAVLQDTLGRLPVITASLGALAIGFTGVGLSSGFLGIAASRAAVGSGVSTWGMTTTVYALDISHPLNRARSMAPLCTASAIGGIIGSMLGGYTASVIGLRNTFLVVGATFAVMLVMANFVLTETVQGARGKTGRKKQGIESLGSFMTVMRYPGVPAIVAFNCANRLCVGTAKMTLLPLFLVNVMGMTASSIGTVFAIMSAIALACVQPAAYLADTMGHRRVLPPTGAIQGAALVVLALSTTASPELLWLGLGLWSLSHALLGSSVYAYVSGVAPNEMRSQACAVVRTSGDVVTIFGGLAFAVFAQKSGLPVSLGTIGALQVLAAGWFLISTVRNKDAK